MRICSSVAIFTSLSEWPHLGTTGVDELKPMVIIDGFDDSR